MRGRTRHADVDPFGPQRPDLSDLTDGSNEDPFGPQRPDLLDLGSYGEEDSSSSNGDSRRVRSSSFFKEQEAGGGEAEDEEFDEFEELQVLEPLVDISDAHARGGRSRSKSTCRTDAHDLKRDNGEGSVLNKLRERQPDEPLSEREELALEDGLEEAVRAALGLNPNVPRPIPPEETVEYGRRRWSSGLESHAFGAGASPEQAA